jgi:hypothetical protein
MLYPCHMLAYSLSFHIERKQPVAKGKAQKKQKTRLAADT